MTAQELIITLIVAIANFFFGQNFAFRLKQNFSNTIGNVVNTTNGDTNKYKHKNYLASFKKGLKQDMNDPNVGNYNFKLMKFFLDNENYNGLNFLPNASKIIKLVDPYSYDSKQMYGKVPQLTHTIVPPKYDSSDFAWYQLELYTMSLLRNYDFRNYAKVPNIDNYISLLNTYRPNGIAPITTDNLFRGQSDGDQIGFYLSQFLLVTIPVWTEPITQFFPPYSNVNFLTSISDYESVYFDGIVPGKITFTNPEYIRCGRSLLTLVHKDSPFQIMIHTSVILWNNYASSFVSPYASTNIAGFNDFSLPMVQSILVMACSLAVRTAFYHKFRLHTVLRPEEFGYNIETGVKGYDKSVLNMNAILTDVKNANGTLLMPVGYPEGAPCHPSYPSGHATIAGAGITVLKAFFKECSPISSPVVPSSDGTKLVPDISILTIGGELDKLASNMSFGRNWAGIHYRMDAQFGITLGEEIAISILRDVKAGLNINWSPVITLHNGDTIII